MNVLFAGASSGGHLYPGLALARALAVDWGLRPHFLTRSDPLGERVLASCEFPRHGIESIGRRNPLTLISARRAVARLFRRLEPAAAVGLGGSASILPALAARTHDVPLFLIEPNRVVGAANRLLLPIAARCFTAFEDTAGSRWLRRRALTVGCPVRAGFEPMPLPKGRTRILVMGGSQGSDPLNRLVSKALPRLARFSTHVAITHLTGVGKGAELRKGYERFGFDARVEEFVAEPQSELAAATLVVARAGGSTLAEILAVGRGALLVPYPHHRDRHQLKNAEALSEAGAAVAVVEDPEVFTRALEELLGAPERVHAMAQAARTFAEPARSAARIAEIIATHLDRAPARWGVTCPRAFKGVAT